VKRLGLVIALAAASGCGSDETCDPLDQTGCDNGQVCEVVDGAEEPACFDPVEARGSVFDLETGAGISGARVVAVDPNNNPVSAVAITDANGDYSLPIPSTRNPNGTPMAIELTLRADAAGYQTFPGGVRQALPIDTAAAVLEDSGAYVVETTLTDIGLEPIPAGTGTGTITGTIDVPPDGVGVLVVAEGPVVGSTIADRTGQFAIFNLAEGSYEVAGYARGVNYERATVDVAADSDSEAPLSLSEAAASTVTGRVELVDAGGAPGTSVILVVESTFNETLVRGAAVPGLRAPEAGIAPDVTGAFTIDGVPEGRYVVLAAFEDDGLVRDPDTCIAGTEIVHQAVGVGETVEIAQSFKVTEALDVLAPGADGAEEVTLSPSFAWVDDSSEDRYDIVVVDSFANIIWTEQIAGVSSGDIQVPYAGSELEAGSYYQFRVISSRSTGNGSRCEISTTEDLEGVFFVP
jgi:hypothetical protein